MPRRLLIANVLLGTVSALCVAYIAQVLVAPTPRPSGRARAGIEAGAPAPSEEAPRPGAAVPAVVVSRNLFNPTRSEGSAAAGGAAPALAARPLLWGVVIRDGASIAYLEDPVTKRTAGYRVGDSIVGGTVQAIGADSVVIARPDGRMDIGLRDPSKPRPAATAAPARPVPPGAPGAPGAPTASAPPATVAPAVPPPTLLPGGRPLPPNLLRRVPPSTSPDAPPR